MTEPTEGQPIGSISIDVGPKQDASAVEGSPRVVPALGALADDVDSDGSVPNFDYVSAAKKLKCDTDTDAVSSAIGILLRELEDRDSKISFFENLFGYSAEYLKACHQDLIRYEDVRLFGQRRLRGDSLQRASIARTGKTLPPEQLAGKVVIDTVQEQHYDIAVLLPVEGKMRIDRALEKMRTEEAKTENETAQAAIEDTCPNSREALLAEKKSFEEKHRNPTLEQSVHPHTTAEQIPKGAQEASPETTLEQQALIEQDTTGSEDNGRKRKRAIVLSDEDDEVPDQKQSRAKLG